MDKEERAIKRMQKASAMSIEKYEQPLVITFSGGKDSSVLLHLAQKAKIPFEVLHNHTTVDAPETVYFTREQLRQMDEKGIKCTIDFPTHKGKRVTMWNLIPQMRMPPTRIVRYCCKVLKEKGGEGRFVATGVRWAESKSREEIGIYETLHRDKRKRISLHNDDDNHHRLFDVCTIKAKRTCNPIIDWTDSDVWDYIKEEKIHVNTLYKCGFLRVGCVGCPMAGTIGRQKQFARYPTYRKAYIQAFDKMLEEIVKRSGENERWKCGADVFHWWMEDGVLPNQETLEGFEDDTI